MPLFFAVMMKMKLLTPLSILILVLGLSFFSSAQAAEPLYGPNSNIGSVSYSVSESNSTAIYYWWDTASSQLLAYQVPSDSFLNVTFLNDGYPPNQGKEPFLSISIGNLTLANTTDDDAESNLALGYWKVKMNGIVSSTDWDAVGEKYDEVFRNSTGTFYFNNSDETYLQGTVFVVSITIDDGFQKTTIAYDAATGLLLEASVTVGNFVLSFVVSSINGNDAFYKNTENELSMNFLWPVFSVLLVALVVRKKS